MLRGLFHIKCSCHNLKKKKALPLSSGLLQANWWWCQGHIPFLCSHQNLTLVLNLSLPPSSINKSSFCPCKELGLKKHRTEQIIVPTWKRGSESPRNPNNFPKDRLSQRNNPKNELLSNVKVSIMEDEYILGIFCPTYHRHLPCLGDANGRLQRYQIGKTVSFPINSLIIPSKARRGKPQLGSTEEMTMTFPCTLGSHAWLRTKVGEGRFIWIYIWGLDYYSVLDWNCVVIRSDWISNLQTRDHLFNIWKVKPAYGFIQGQEKN